jgi:hypothetical protein
MKQALSRLAVAAVLAVAAGTVAGVATAGGNPGEGQFVDDAIGGSPNGCNTVSKTDAGDLWVAAGISITVRVSWCWNGVSQWVTDKSAWGYAWGVCSYGGITGPNIEYDSPEYSTVAAYIHGWCGYPWNNFAHRTAITANRWGGAS